MSGVVSKSPENDVVVIPLPSSSSMSAGVDAGLPEEDGADDGVVTVVSTMPQTLHVTGQRDRTSTP